MSDLLPANGIIITDSEDDDEEQPCEDFVDLAANIIDFLAAKLLSKRAK